MRLKYYLRGLGLGIIFTCLMFMLFSNKTTNKNTDQADIYNQIDAATETLSDQTGGSDKTDTLDDTDTSDGAEEQSDINATDSAEAQNNTDLQDNTDAQDNTDVQNTDAQNSADSSDTAGEAGTADVQDEYVTLVIEQGDIARDVAESLYEDGIIDDVESFRKYLGETGVSKTLHAGEYNIKVGSTYEEIVELLK